MPRRKGRSHAMYGITRIDDEKHCVYAWRVSLRRQGKALVKNFPDKKHRGKGKALKLAKQYRDELLKKYPPLSRRAFCTILRANNKTGISGVYTYAKSYKLRDGKLMQTRYWEANWPDDEGKSLKVAYSVKEHGEAKAKELAIRARNTALRSINGVFWASERAVVNAR